MAVVGIGGSLQEGGLLGSDLSVPHLGARQLGSCLEAGWGLKFCTQASRAQTTPVPPASPSPQQHTEPLLAHLGNGTVTPPAGCQEDSARMLRWHPGGGCYVANTIVEMMTPPMLGSVPCNAPHTMPQHGGGSPASQQRESHRGVPG